MHPKPFDDEIRVRALETYALLDTPEEDVFDRITRCAAHCFDAPIVLISLIDGDRQWFKSCIGVAIREIPRDISFCSHALMRDTVMVVPDATADPRFATNPLVLGDPHVRFYAGAPLVTADGHRLGTLCIVDRVPRPMLSADQQRVLRDLAATAVECFEARRLRLGAGRESTSEGWHQEMALARKRAEMAKSEFLALMSDELRTPLNAVIGFSDLLTLQAHGPLGHSAYIDYALTISDSTHHLSVMIDTILEFAAAGSGDIAIHDDVVDLTVLTDQAVRLLSETARRAEIAIERQPLGALPCLRADSRYVLQMLVSLIGNGIKFNRTGGRVVIGGSEDVSGAVCLTVTDTGIGIAPEAMDQVEAPFEQIEQALTRRQAGMGLGFSLTRRLAELHGGTLSYDSEPGRGTSVALHFPAYRSVRG